MKANKTDAADAEAICEAATRPTMRFVPVKTADQPAALSLHRARSGLVKARTAIANQIRGLLEEFGVVLGRAIKQVREKVPALLEDGDLDLPCLFRRTLKELHTHLRELDERIEALEHELKAWHRMNDASRRLEKIPGVGWLTATRALVASIGDARTFKNGRQLASPDTPLGRPECSQAPKAICDLESIDRDEPIQFLEPVLDDDDLSSRLRLRFDHQETLTVVRQIVAMPPARAHIASQREQCLGRARHEP